MVVRPDECIDCAPLDVESAFGEDLGRVLLRVEGPASVTDARDDIGRHILPVLAHAQVEEDLLV